MTGFDETLTRFRSWAGTTERNLSGDPETDVAKLGMLFDLIPDYLGMEDPARLAEGDLTRLLLDVYPRKVTVLNREDTAGTIPSLRDLIAYLANTDAITSATAQALGRELDEIEPDFADEVMDPANWGPAKATVHAMHRDGVDFNDSAAVNQWIAQQNAGQFAYEEADPLTWDDVDLKDAFGIPNVVAPIRLPDEAVLTALASGAPLLTDLHDLARHVRITTVRIPDVDPLLFRLAVETELVDADGDTLVAGDDVGWLDDLADDWAAMEAWDYTFAHVLDTTLEAADPTEPRVGEDLDLTGHGIALVTELFLAGRAGVPVAELSASLKSAAVAELSPEATERHWSEWTGAHGDPARLLLGQLAKLSAVTVEDEVARLEPLALFTVAAKLRASDVSVPELPPPDEMTADDVVLVSMFGTEENFEAELASWLAKRTPENAARELLALAAGESVGVRTVAIPIVSRLGAAAEPAWREALDRPELRPYAKKALLTQLVDRDQGGAVPAELMPGTEDLAWLVADSFAPHTRLDHGNGTFPFDISELADAGWTVSNEALFEAMARLDHPDAEAVLTMLGKHVDDKKLAKAARRAAYKASTRRAARR
ncbi:MAG: hypothetical protein ABSA93_38330 [Streptosporangiaceae bacterium]